MSVTKPPVNHGLCKESKADFSDLAERPQDGNRFLTWLREDLVRFALFFLGAFIPIAGLYFITQPDSEHIFLPAMQAGIVLLSLCCVWAYTKGFCCQSMVRSLNLRSLQNERKTSIHTK